MPHPFMTSIYRSDTKVGLYIYLAENKKITDLDNELLNLVGKHTFIMDLDLNSRDKLANEDIVNVKRNLTEKGYHVQLPHDIIKNVLKYT